jgi:hypothetical protein
VAHTYLATANDGRHRWRAEQAAAANNHARHPGGGGHGDDPRQRFCRKVAPVTAEHQRRAWAGNNDD